MSNTKNIDQKLPNRPGTLRPGRRGHGQSPQTVSADTHLDPLLAGRRRGRLRERRPGTGRRPGWSPAYPGKARTANELRGDFEKALSVIPGSHRFNLHACYAEMGGKKVDRDALSAGPFQELDRLGQGPQDPAWTSTRPTSRIRRCGRVHDHQRRRGHSQVLDRARPFAAARSAAAIGKALGKDLRQPTSGSPTA